MRRRLKPPSRTRAPHPARLRVTGDLKSVVLHKMTMSSQQSTFPVALGLRITGVDDQTFAQTGESYSTIALPNANSHTSRTLQEDNTDLAYEFVSTTALNPRVHRNTLLTHDAPHAGAQVPGLHGREPFREGREFLTS